MKTTALHIDCLEYMATLEDNAFDLAIVDPPYGEDGLFFKGGRSKSGSSKLYKGWDKKPGKEYFYELFRVSINQIIWGGNYFHLSPTRGIIFWDKKQPVNNYSDGEMAWTSFNKPAKIFRYGYTNVINYEPRIHPTQKPVALYRWLLTNYAKPGDRILDTHLGSGSSRIAAEEMGFEFVGCELDKEYFEAQEKRFNTWYSQGNLFRPDPSPAPQPVQLTIE